jgi:hypothetical protein
MARDNDLSTLGKELGRAGAADATARPGDDGDAVFEAEVHCFLQSPIASLRAKRSNLRHIGDVQVKRDCFVWLAMTAPYET